MTRHRLCALLVGIVLSLASPALAHAQETVIYYHTDAIGSVRVITNESGQVVARYDYAPFGQPWPELPANPDVRQFAGKERDPETTFNYFGARYYESRTARFTSVDPVLDIGRSLLDPQQWNRYAYARNNPLAHVDPTGEACFALNYGSDYCIRASEYGTVDAQLREHTRFFAAASAVSQALADTDIPVVSRVFVSASTQEFLLTLGRDLQAMNASIAGAILGGSLSGNDLDARIVHMEQTMVQNSLDALKQKNPAAYATVIAENNDLLNGRGILSVAASTFATDRAYMTVLNSLRNRLKRDLDFSKQSDREALGNALIQHIRSTGGCDVAGQRLAGC